jgi:hypothetical protein
MVLELFGPTVLELDLATELLDLASEELDFGASYLSVMLK